MRNNDKSMENTISALVETEGARRATGVSTNASAGESVPDPEVSEKAKRRKFTAQYKLRILQEADTCISSGQIGALLRREGLYSSNLTTWRRQQQRGTLEAFHQNAVDQKRKKMIPQPDV